MWYDPPVFKGRSLKKEREFTSRAWAVIAYLWLFAWELDWLCFKLLLAMWFGNNLTRWYLENKEQKEEEANETI